MFAVGLLWSKDCVPKLGRSIFVEVTDGMLLGTSVDDADVLLASVIKRMPF